MDSERSKPVVAEPWPPTRSTHGQAGETQAASSTGREGWLGFARVLGASILLAAGLVVAGGYALEHYDRAAVTDRAADWLAPIPQAVAPDGAGSRAPGPAPATAALPPTSDPQGPAQAQSAQAQSAQAQSAQAQSAQAQSAQAQSAQAQSAQAQSAQVQLGAAASPQTPEIAMASPGPQESLVTPGGATALPAIAPQQAHRRTQSRPMTVRYSRRSGGFYPSDNFVRGGYGGG